jgi:hypothetical protein
MVRPDMLENLDLIWTIVLDSTDKEVTECAGDLLVRLHTSLDEPMKDQVPEIINGVIDKCLTMVKDSKQSAGFVSRVVGLLKKVIADTEKKGMNGVLPHNSILNGECLDRIIIKNETRLCQANIVVRVFTSASVWEFICEVAYMLELPP